MGQGIDLMDQESNFAKQFFSNTLAKPHEVAIAYDNSERTYGELAGLSLSIALHMLANGVKPQDVVGVRSDDLETILSTQIACALLGCAWVSLNKPTIILSRIKVDKIFDAMPVEAALPGDAVNIGAHWAFPPNGATLPDPNEFPGYIDPDDFWIINYTSGTTGTPKLVGLSYRISHRRNLANGSQLGPQGKKITCLFPPNAPPLLTRYHAVLFHRGTIVESLSHETWLRYDVDQVVGSPAQTRKVLAGVKVPRKLKRIHLSGSTASEATLRPLLETFEEVVNGYGSTEAQNCLLMFKSLDSEGNIQTRTVQREVEIEIVDQDNQKMAQGETGIVRIRNDRMVNGYINNPEATRIAFRNGWFYPGDLGYFTDGGQLVVVGRENDQFNVRGVKLNATLLDFTLQGIEGVEDAICFMMPKENDEPRLTALIEVEPGFVSTDIFAKARIELLRLAGNEAVPERIYSIKDLPRNRSGKADRQGCVELIREIRASKRKHT